MEHNSFLKEINIGHLIKMRRDELDVSYERLSNFLLKTHEEIESIFQNETIDSGLLLKFSKILEYDFFRVYSQHLIFYAPPSAITKSKTNEKKKITPNLPIFRKNIYTREAIDFILHLIDTNQKTKNQIIEDYRIPKTTLYKWISKYNKE